MASSARDIAWGILARLNDDILPNAEARQDALDRLRADLLDLAGKAGFIVQENPGGHATIFTDLDGTVLAFSIRTNRRVEIQDYGGTQWERPPFVYVPEARNWVLKDKDDQETPAIVWLAEALSKSLRAQKAARR